MTQIKPQHSSAAIRGEPLRQRVIDAAEQLLRQGKADFTMRDLAAEAGVSFATPFNQFGSKAAIMQAISARLIDAMTKRFSEVPSQADVIGRVQFAVSIATGVMLEDAEVNRAVMGWIGAPSPTPGQVLEHSAALWRLALSNGHDLVAADSEQLDSQRRLPEKLAFAFRGVLSFWAAGELPDERLAECARDVAQTLLSGTVER